MDEHLLRQAGERLSGWGRTMILSHQRPDGDALGAMSAMLRVIRSAGRSATAFVYEAIPSHYKFLDHDHVFTAWPAILNDIKCHFDGILIVDTCSWQQLDPAAEFLRSAALPKIVVDHHATRDALGPEDGRNLYVIDESAASACVQIYEWCELMDWPIDIDAAEALFTGLATDTGWFRFSNTDARTLRAAAAMNEDGARVDVIHGRLFASHKASRIRLMSEMLKTLEFDSCGRLAVMWLTPDMFERTGASRNETEDLINEPMSVKAVLASVLLIDQGNGEVRVSLRSKSPEVCGLDVDVSSIAEEFGGGGHRRAAGARVMGKLEEVRNKVRSAVSKVIEEQDGGAVS